MTLAKFEDISIHECGEPLVDLGDYSFILEPSYFNQGLSTESRMFLRQSVAEKLMEIQKGLSEYTFKIWDGFRPRSVQKVIYEKFLQELHIAHPDWDEEKLKTEVGVFVTTPNNPKRVPPHATGGAIDLTLVDAQGKELDMGTAFDHFGPEAEPFYFEKSAQNHQVQENRKVLRGAMLEADFAIDKDEWWHFDYGNQRWALALGRTNAIFGEVEIQK